eukprot:gene9059-14028_t
MVKATKDVKGKAVTLKDADAAKFVAAYAKHLKAQGKLEIPKWTELAKTGTMCELAPQDPDWFFNRVASVARQVYIRSGSGIGGLRKRYGGSYQKIGLFGLQVASYDFMGLFIFTHSPPLSLFGNSLVGVLTMHIQHPQNCIRPHFQRAAGGPIRKALQSLEALGILEKKVDGGRQITAKGAQDMDRIAAGVVLG